MQSDTALTHALDHLLDRERAALVAGDLDSLPGLLAEKEELIDRLVGSERAETDSIQTLRGKASRNQQLLDSALDGLRAVTARMAELRRVRAGLDTYDMAGRRQVHDVTPRPQVERRA